MFSLVNCGEDALEGDFQRFLAPILTLLSIVQIHTEQGSVRSDASREHLENAECKWKAPWQKQIVSHAEMIDGQADNHGISSLFCYLSTPFSGSQMPAYTEVHAAENG